MILRFSFRLTIFFCQALKVRLGGAHRQVELGGNRADHSVSQYSLLLDIAGRGDEQADRLPQGTPPVDSIPYHRHQSQKFRRALEASRRIFLQKQLE